MRNRNYRWALLHAILLLYVAAAGCRSEQNPAKAVAQTPAITLVGISPILEPLANFYRARLPDVTFSLRQGSSGMLANVDYLHSGMGDVTFTQSDIAYTALTNEKPACDLQEPDR